MQPSHAPTRADRLARRLALELGATLSDPTNRARVVHMLGLVTLVGPDLSDDHLLALVRFGLSTFLFDDLADRGEAEVEDVRWRAEQLASSVGESPSPELWFDPTARLLRELSATLRQAGADPAVQARWTGLTQAAFRAMATQRAQAEARRRGEPVPREALLEAGRESVAVEALCATSWALLGVPAEALEPLAAQAHALARAVRLANDLRSVARDVEEGATSTLADLSPHEIAALRAEIEAEVQAAARRAEALAGVAGRAAALDLALGRALVRFYGAQDFHDLPVRGAMAPIRETPPLRPARPQAWRRRPHQIGAAGSVRAPR